MASVASQLIEEATAHAQSDSLEDAREICADGTYFPNNLHNLFLVPAESPPEIYRWRNYSLITYALDLGHKIVDPIL